MANNSVNIPAFVTGEELGRIAAHTAIVVGPRCATASLVQTMNKALEEETPDDAADLCMGAMLAYTDGLKAIVDHKDENADEGSSGEDDPLGALFGDVLGALGGLLDSLRSDGENDAGEDEG